jgi:general stress protein 26
MEEEQGRELLWRLVTKIQICMMSTRDGGEVRARPMKGFATPERNAIWFLSDRDGAKTDEIATDPTACLTYADIRGNSYVSLSGTLTEVRDPDQVEQLLSEAGEAYFPERSKDERVALLHFSPDRGEYWDAPSNPLVIAIKFIEAQLTQTRPVLGKNEKIDLQS